MAGLASNAHIRLIQSEQEPLFDEAGEIIIEPENENDNLVTDDKGNIVQVEHADGSVTISLDGGALDANGEKLPKGWYDNLAEEIDEGTLYGIADDLLRGIDDDIESRREWIEDRAQGIKLLGLKIELPNQGGSAEGAPVEGMSKVRHPLLMEATLRFQANARGEFLPTDGPVKIRDDSNNPTLEQDELAKCYGKDMNHYLTTTASEYYPDTDRMFLLLGFGGTTFKKVYFCPLRNRPVSETVDADDLIVNNSATDLKNAHRVTHRIYMKPSTLKRFQIIGTYLDVDLPDAPTRKLDSVQEEKNAQQGIRQVSMRPEDNDREIYECYCELDLPGYEHKLKGKLTGLPVPYRVTIDVASRTILSIVRNYPKTTEDLPVARTTFVKYTYVPGFGFYDIGLLHILGNTTNAVTAAWREMLDAGMFANFPGFLVADTGGRQNTNIFRVPPGGGAQIKTGGMPINQAVMPLPYKEPGPALPALIQNMVEAGQRVGGTAELSVGEGRQDAPVGTTLALIDQAQKIINSVHKRVHTAQAQEFQLIVECFKEHPESFWKTKDKLAASWDQETFERAINNYELIPVADPNTSSQTQRVMKIMGLKQLQATNPNLDGDAIDKAAMIAMGWSNPEQFFKPEAQRNQPPPEVLKGMKELELKERAQQTSDAKTKADIAINQARVILDEQRLEIDGRPEAPEAHDPAKMIDAQTKVRMAELKEQDNQIKMADVHLDAQNRAADRESRERMGMAKIIQDGIEHPEGLKAVKPLLTPEFQRNLREDG